MIPLRWRLPIAALLGALASLPALAAAPDAEHWYQISIASHPAGYVHELTRPHDSAGSQTQTETRIAVQRMSTRVDFRVEQTEEEDSEGHLRRLQVRIHGSAGTR